MLKKLIISALLISFSFSDELNLNQNLLTGDTKLSCEAILCLSSGERPSECTPSLNYYFGLNAKKWSDTLKKRKNFLSLCPVGTEAENDKNFTNLRDNIILNITEPCSLEVLNSKIEELIEEKDIDGITRQITKVRINPNLTQSCKLLMSSSYTNVKPVYSCDPTKWYDQLEWYNGKTTTILESLSYFQYIKLTPIEKQQYKQITDENYNYYYVKTKTTPINKNCWQWEE